MCLFEIVVDGIDIDSKCIKTALLIDVSKDLVSCLVDRTLRNVAQWLLVCNRHLGDRQVV